MKRMMKLLLSAIVGGVVLTLATGCASTKSNQQALVCPQCKVVTVTRTVAVLPEGEGNLPIEDQEVTETQHSCPGCQGALATFFKEGKLRHKCSICEQSPFSCPVTHR